MTQDSAGWKKAVEMSLGARVWGTLEEEEGSELGQGPGSTSGGRRQCSFRHREARDKDEGMARVWMI